MKNAVKLAQEAVAIGHMLDVMDEVLSGEVPEDGMTEMEAEKTKMIEFMREGGDHAMAFHAYGHSPQAPQPDWARAGFWSRRAVEYAEAFWPKLQALRDSQ